MTWQQLVRIIAVIFFVIAALCGFGVVTALWIAWALLGVAAVVLSTV